MTDLTDRMRTCAAHILREGIYIEGELPAVYRDAADLLIEASNIIEAAKLGTVLVDDETAKALGLPMEIMTPWVEDPLAAPEVTESLGPHMMPTPDFPIDRTPSSMWIAPGGPLPGLKHSGTISSRACPRCDSRANKRVSRQGKHLMLVCPACAHEWPYAKKPPAEGTAGGKS